jgi:hypothetical protein
MPDLKDEQVTVQVTDDPAGSRYLRRRQFESDSERRTQRPSAPDLDTSLA